ncbi:MAG: asparagine synthetase B [Flavobacteriales bacterium]|nr:asparagine synthetase B [Flavobacteriales bacterium]
MKKIVLLLVLSLFIKVGYSSYLLIPMDEGKQTNHLKAYGIAFWVLQNDIELEWLLNYRGGSFLIKYYKDIEKECVIRGVSYELIADVQASSIKNSITDPEVNQEVVKLETAPKIAVYTPTGKMPWDDAVTMVLEYAEIPYDKIYDSAIINMVLPKYDWLHLHHEDFTGQYGKFYAAYKNAAWYQKQQRDAEASATSLGFNKVSELKLGVSTRIKEFVAGGGFLFTMCSGTDSYDISLAAHNTDICASMFDGDAADRQAQSKLDFSQTLAFKDFKLVTNPLQYEFSSIDGTSMRFKQRVPQNQDIFNLFEFSAKWDIVPTMLCQNHTSVVQGFMGQTTDFKKEYIKSSVTIMGETKAMGTVRYMSGELGEGRWTFYGGHDPEDYQHRVGDPPTDLNLHPNSPGYRLILNNILFPAAKKKKRKT